MTDAQGLSATSAPITISADNTPPTASIDTPAVGTTWKVGDLISFYGSATDPQDGFPRRPCPGSWSCSTAPRLPCHSPGAAWTGRLGRFFNAPDHEYPSYLELRLTATDAGGLTDTKLLRLDPRTVFLSFAPHRPACN